MKIRAALLLILFAVAACGEGNQTAAPPAGHQVFVLATDGSARIEAYDPAGHIQRTLPLGIPASDWSLLYVASANGEQTLLQAIDTRTGNAVRSTSIEGAYGMPKPNMSALPQGLSPNGRWLVLGGKGRFAVIDTAFATKPTLISLAGDFEFDALSNDGKRLYLAQALPHGYQVRLYDLRRGLVSQPIVDKAEIETAMSGFRVTGVDEPEGRFHFGLYVRPDEPAFVHVLPIYDDVGFAFCVDLPWPGYIAPAPDWSLARTGDGRFLYATSGMLRRVAEIDTSDYPKLARSLEVPRPTGARNPFLVDVMAKEESIAPGAVLSADARRLFFPDLDGIDVVDLAAFKVAGRFLAGEFVQSLVAGPDGSLFALSLSGRVFRIDPRSGRVVDGFDIQGRVERLLFVTAAAQHG